VFKLKKNKGYDVDIYIKRQSIIQQSLKE
jgi:hypothetical protein